MLDSLKQKFTITFVQDNRWKFFVNGFFMTLLLTLASFTLGTIIGIIFCALRFTKIKPLIKVVDIVNGFFVQIPTLVFLMIMVYLIFGKSSLSVTVVVIIGLSIKTGSYMSDIFYAALKATSDGEAEAARALGMNRIQAFTYVTLPQAINNSLDVYKNQFISTIQETSVVSSLAIQELTKASSIVTSRTLDSLFSLIFISILYLLIGYVGNAILDMLENKKHLENV